MLNCSLLRAIRLEWPTGVPPFLLFRGLCLRHLCLVLPSLPTARFSRCLLSNHSRFSLLKADHPKRLPDKARVSLGLLPSSSCPHHDTQQEANNKDPFTRGGLNYLQWPVLLHLGLLLCVQSLLSLRRGPTPP
jgi:hypothetical protein